MKLLSSRNTGPTQWPSDPLTQRILYLFQLQSVDIHFVICDLLAATVILTLQAFSLFLFLFYSTRYIQILVTGY